MLFTESYNISHAPQPEVGKGRDACPGDVLVLDVHTDSTQGKPSARSRTNVISAQYVEEPVSQPQSGVSRSGVPRDGLGGTNAHGGEEAEADGKDDGMPNRFWVENKRKFVNALAQRGAGVEDCIFDIKLMPLRFCSRKFELMFRQQSAEGMQPKVMVVSAINCLAICLLWISHSFAPGLSAGYNQLQLLAKMQEPAGTITLATGWMNIVTLTTGYRFHLLMGVNFVLPGACFLAAFLLASNAMCAERTLYAAVVVGQLATTSIILLMTGSSVPGFDQETDPELLKEIAKLVPQLIWWSDMISLCCLTLPIIALDCILASRTCVTWLLHVIYAIAIFTNHAVIHTRYRHYQEPLIPWINAILIFLVVLVAFIGRYVRELQERINFWSLLRNQLRLRVLHHEVQRLTPPRGVPQGESTMEELMSLLRHSLRLVGHTSTRIISPDLIRAEEIIKEVLRILSHGGNLFQVRFDNLPEEGESIIDQYIWGKSLVKSGSTAVAPPHYNQDRWPSSVRQTDRDSTIATRREDGAGYDKKSGKRRASKRTRQETKRRIVGDSIGVAPSNRILDTPTGEGYSPTSPSITARDLDVCKMGGKVGVDWDFDVFGFEREHPNIFLQFGAFLLLPHAAYLAVPESRILQFLTAMEELYWLNPYHNRIHAAVVAHATCCLVKMLDLPSGSAYTQVTELVYVVAALGHDIGHPSRNNQFFVNTFDPLALIYNDVSVLENYHAFMTFQIFDQEGCDIFQSFIVDWFRDVRKRIIETILGTDMKEHFEAISKFRVRRGAAGFDMLGESDDLWHTIRILVKAADLSHACVGWDMHLEWSCRIQEEFYQQGDEEALLGYPKSPLCDRDAHAGFAKGQKGFLEFVVAPLYMEISEADPGDRIAFHCVRQLQENKAAWAQIDASGARVEFPEHVTSIQTIPPHLNSESGVWGNEDLYPEGDSPSDDGSDAVFGSEYASNRRHRRQPITEDDIRRNEFRLQPRDVNGSDASFRIGHHKRRRQRPADRTDSLSLGYSTTDGSTGSGSEGRGGAQRPHSGEHSRHSATGLIGLRIGRSKGGAVEELVDVASGGGAASVRGGDRPFNDSARSLSPGGGMPHRDSRRMSDVRHHTRNAGQRWGDTGLTTSLLMHRVEGVTAMPAAGNDDDYPPVGHHSIGSPSSGARRRGGGPSGNTSAATQNIAGTTRHLQWQRSLADNGDPSSGNRHAYPRAPGKGGPGEKESSGTRMRGLRGKVLVPG